MTVKTMVAREWLYLLAFLFGGLLAAPSAITFIFSIFRTASPGETFGGHLDYFYSALFSSEEGIKKTILLWVIVMAPYLIFQLYRSIRWALRVTREEGGGK